MTPRRLVDTSHHHLAPAHQVFGLCLVHIALTGGRPGKRARWGRLCLLRSRGAGGQ